MQRKNNLEKNSLRGKLTSNNYMRISIDVLKKFDAATAVFITFLVQLEIYNEEKQEIDKDGFFMIKRDYIQSRIGFTKKIQMRVTKALMDKNLIQFKRKGVPQKCFVKLNHSLINLVLDNASDFTSED